MNQQRILEFAQFWSKQLLIFQQLYDDSSGRKQALDLTPSTVAELMQQIREIASDILPIVSTQSLGEWVDDTRWRQVADIRVNATNNQRLFDSLVVSLVYHSHPDRFNVPHLREIGKDISNVNPHSLSKQADDLTKTLLAEGCQPTMSSKAKVLLVQVLVSLFECLRDGGKVKLSSPYGEFLREFTY